jgi:putative PIN family toxin of toxin-antitoxin system
VRIVTDTNTLVSGLLWQGPPRRIVDWAREQIITLCTSPALLAELTDVLGRKKFIRRLGDAGLTAEAPIQDYARLADLIEAPPLPHAVSRDPDDDHVLACALPAHADVIVSGDADLLSLRAFQGIPILSPAQAIARIGETGKLN